MDIALLCQIFFSLGTAIDVGGPMIPPFRKYIMNYGPRSTISTSNPSKFASHQSKIVSLLEYVGSFQVPHTWFTHYYVISVASSVFWAFQIYVHGTAFEFIASFTKPRLAAMTADQVFLAWLLMAIQGTRRLYESIAFTKPSQSKMWAGTWIIGMAFYVFMGISVWIEGIGLFPGSSLGLVTDFPASLNDLGRQRNLLEFSKPTVKASLAILIFLGASGVQHDCHKHLASLKKYSLPRSVWFQRVVCPHYTSECLIYVAIALAAAPQGQVLNKTVLAALGFVASNLAVTADSTRKWYIEKFGIEKVAGHWRMIPYVY